MKKLRLNNLDSKWVPLITITLCLLMCMYMLLHGAPHYNTNDDVTLNRIAVGDYGELNSKYLVFSNICYGELISFLYRHFAGINWYAVIPLALSVLAILIIAYILTKESQTLGALVAAVAFVFFFGENVLIEVQFTHFAGFLSASGLFILYYALFRTERLKPDISYIGIILALFGYWFRRDAFLSVAAIFGVCCALKMLKNRFWTISYAELFKEIGFFIILFALIISSGIISHFEYQNDEGWKYWTEYNTLRASLLDYTLPDYDEYKDEYQEIGVDRLDFEMLISWNYADQNKFSLETLEKLSELQQSVKQEKFNIWGEMKTAIKAVLLSMKDNQEFTCILAVAVSCVVLRKENRWLLLPLTVIGIELIYLSVNGRFIFRSYFGLWVSIALVVALAIVEQLKKQTEGAMIKKEHLAATLVFVFIIGCPWIYRIHLYQHDMTNAINSQLETYSWREVIAEDEESLYVHETLFGGIPSSLLALEETPQYNHNIYCLGGWTCPSPLQEYLLEKYDIEEEGIMQALLDDEKPVYYIEMQGEDKHVRLLEYLRKEYTSLANVELIRQFEGICVYRFYVAY